MLPLRVTVFAAITAVALWGLFSLLENLREPELLRSTQAVVVKGCDVIETDEARALCPSLFCQKALLDGRKVPLRAGFEVTADIAADDQHLIGGTARATPQSAPVTYACVLQSGKVQTADIVDAEHLRHLADSGGDWLVDEAGE